MEQREQGGHHVGTAQLDNVVTLLGVGNHVLVGEFNTLRRAFGTRTEQDHGIVIEFGRGEPQTAQNGCRARTDNECRNKTANRRHLGFFFVQVNHLAFAGNLSEGRVFAAKLVEEGASCNHCGKVGLLDASENRIHRSGVVQVHRRLAGAENRHDTESGVAAGGHHEAHVLVILGGRLDHFTEVMAQANHSVTVHVVTGGVDQNHAAATLAHGLEPQRNNGGGMVHGNVPNVGIQKFQVVADFFFGRVRWQRL